MTLATTYVAALIVGIFSLLCLGSWANTLKLASRWRFELFYLDFSLGALLTSVVLAFTAGTLGFDSFTFLDDFVHAGKRSIAYGFLAGAVFNLGNMLLVAGMSLVGMSVAFLIGAGLAGVVAALVSHMTGPAGITEFVLTGAAVVALAVVVCALAYRSMSLLRELARMKAGEHRTLRPSVSWKGILLSLAAGIVLGSYAPLLELARQPEIGLGPYALGFLFCAGICFSTFIYSLYFMNLPVKGKPLEILQYFRSRLSQHLWGWLGGALWALGSIAAFVLAASPQEAKLDPVHSSALTLSPVLLATLWGLIVWREFRGADAKVNALLVVMCFLLAAGLTLLSLAQMSLPG